MILPRHAVPTTHIFNFYVKREEEGGKRQERARERLAVIIVNQKLMRYSKSGQKKGKKANFQRRYLLYGFCPVRLRD